MIQLDGFARITVFIVVVRIAYLCLVIISSIHIADHDAEGVTLFAPAWSSDMHNTLLSPFTKWDAAHFLRIASHGYVEDQSFAFFPLFPCCVAGLSRLIGILTETTFFHCSKAEIDIVAAVLIANICFVFAVAVLYRLFTEYYVMEEMSTKSTTDVDQSISNEIGTGKTTEHVKSYLHKELDVSCKFQSGPLMTKEVVKCNPLQLTQLCDKETCVNDVQQRQKAEDVDDNEGDDVLQPDIAMAVMVTTASTAELPQSLADKNCANSSGCNVNDGATTDKQIERELSCDISDLSKDMALTPQPSPSSTALVSDKCMSSSQLAATAVPPTCAPISPLTPATLLLLCVLFNPSSIFFSVPYSESLYAFCAWAAIYCLESRTQVGYAIAGVLFFLASCTRSNGLFNIIFVWMHFLQLLGGTSATPEVGNGTSTLVKGKHNIKGSDAALVHELLVGDEILANSDAVLVPIPTATFVSRSLPKQHMPAKGLQLAVVLKVVCLVFFCIYLSVCVVSPYITWNYITAWRLCGKHYSSASHRTASASANLSHLCASTLPSAYSYIQHKYWNVGFLRYYQWKQWPNFLMAAPIFIAGVSVIKRYIRDTPNVLDIVIFDPKRKGAHIIHLYVCMLVCACNSHIQISTRLLLSSCPILYIEFANLSMRCLGVGSRRDTCGTIAVHLSMAKWIWGYCAVYTIAGIVLYPNFYPWT